MATHGQTEKYLIAAQNSVEFLMKAKGPQIYDGFGVGFDEEDSGISVRKGDPDCNVSLPNKASSTSVAETMVFGLLLEGLSTLFSLTGNSTLQDMIVALILAPDSPLIDPEMGGWSPETGVLQETCFNHSSDPFLLRGISEVMKLESLRSDLREFLKAFIGVQYNAAQISPRNDHIYGCALTEGPPSVYGPVNQTRTLQLLVDGISVFNETGANASPAPTASNTSSSTFPGRPGNSKTGIIAGAVVGGIIACLLICGAMYWFFKRRRVASRMANNSSNQFGISPFISQNVETPAQGEKGRRRETPIQSVNVSPPRQHTPSLRESAHPGETSEGAEAIPSVGRTNIDDADREERFAATQGLISVPELIRFLHQRMRHSEGQENPPEYQSQLG